MRAIRKLLKSVAVLIAFLLATIVIYFLVAFIFSIIPVKGEPFVEGPKVEIFLVSNGVHSDLALPVRNEIKDWSKEIKFNHTTANDTTNRFLTFGWGDKAFYLETPTWSDLKLKTAVSAAFGLGPSAIHATFFRNLMEDEDCVKIYLSIEQYKRLVAYIEQSFERDKQGNVQLIETTAVYGQDDAFYEATKRYNLFRTCNTWTNKGLKACGQRACLWTPFDKGIFYHYE